MPESTETNRLSRLKVIHSLSPYSIEQFRRDFSPRLLANPHARLEAGEEFDWYWNNQISRYGTEYTNRLDKLLSQQTLDATKDDTDFEVVIAVAGHQEQDNVYRTCECYAGQVDRNGLSLWNQSGRLRPSIVLYINWPSSGNTPRVLKTLSEIERFKSQYPEVSVRVYSEELKSQPPNSLGLIKKTAFDLALRRRSQQGRKDDFFIVMHDADMLGLPPTYFSRLSNMACSERGKEYDILSGSVIYPLEVYRFRPTFFALMSFIRIFRLIDMQHRGYPASSGANTAMRASTYAAVGGHRRSGLGSDLELGQLVQIARQGNSSLKYAASLPVITDPRRYLQAFDRHIPIANAYDNFEDSVREKPSIDINEVIDIQSFSRLPTADSRIVEFNQRFVQECSALLTKISTRVKSRGSPEEQAYFMSYYVNIFQATFHRLGVDADITIQKNPDSRIHICFRNLENFQNRLPRFYQNLASRQN